VLDFKNLLKTECYKELFFCWTMFPSIGAISNRKTYIKKSTATVKAASTSNGKQELP
jgi:hypothetical protein